MVPMAKRKHPVDPAEVRRWAKDRNWRDQRGRPVAEVGRFQAELVYDFNNDPANVRKGIYYEPLTPPSAFIESTPKERHLEDPDELVEVTILIPRKYLRG